MDDKELIFETRALFREWLENAGTTSDGIWLVFAKTNTLKTLSAHEALEEALCFGWIDGQMQSINEDKYRKYFARRREKSNWSDKNKELARKLIQKGLMTPKGMEAVACAKQNGQWDNSKRSTASEEQQIYWPCPILCSAPIHCFIWMPNRIKLAKLVWKRLSTDLIRTSNPCSHDFYEC